MNELHIEVQALDKPFGYLVLIIAIINGERTKIKEHYATEADAKARLATAWQFWANNVDAE